MTLFTYDGNRGVKGNYNGKAIDIPFASSSKIGSDVIKGRTFAGAGQFNVVLYRKGQNASSLANEAGDIMFAFQENDISVDEKVGFKTGREDYFSKASSQYSFAVQSAFTNRKNGELTKSRTIYPLLYSRNKIIANDGGTLKDE